MSRTERYDGLIPRNFLQKCIHIIGVGAIGRQVALQLGAMGAEYLHLYDFDEVDDTNMGTQGYTPKDLGRLKVDVLERDLKRLNPEIKVKVDPRPFSDFTGRPDVVFMCVDTMAVRRQIVEKLHEYNNDTILVDGRMKRFDIRIISVPGDKLQNYWNTWFPDGEANNTRCTAQTTIFMANIAAGLMVYHWVMHQKGDWFFDMQDVLFGPEMCMPAVTLV